MKILGIGQGKLIPSYRYRLKEVKDSFKNKGLSLSLYESRISSYPPSNKVARFAWIINLFFSRLPLLFEQKRYDLIILQREIVSTLYTFERLFYKPFILDIDDAIHLHQRVNSIDKIATKASAIVVCNSYLFDYYKQLNANVHIIPTPINIDKYIPSQKRKTSDIVIGWIGTSSNFPSLKLVEKQLSKFLHDNSNAILKIVSNEDPKLLTIPHNQYIFKLWSDKEDVQDIQSFDIGIMPLIENEQSHGKCAFKMLQYMSCGIPVVSTCLPMNKSILDTKECGYCVTNENNTWYKAIDKLFNDPNLRDRFAKNGRWIIENYYSTEIYIKLYIQVIESLTIEGKI